MEVRGQLHALAVLLPAKSPSYPLARRLRGTQSYSGHFGKAEVSCRYLGAARRQIRVLVRRQKPLKCLVDRGLGAAQIVLRFDVILTCILVNMWK